MRLDSNGDWCSWFEVEAQLADLTQRLQQAEQERERLAQWRSWAQFVYLSGGEPEGTDRELQARVCEAHDAQVEEVRTRADEHFRLMKDYMQQAEAADAAQRTLRAALEAKIAEWRGSVSANPEDGSEAWMDEGIEFCADQLAALLTVSDTPRTPGSGAQG